MYDKVAKLKLFIFLFFLMTSCTEKQFVFDTEESNSLTDALNQGDFFEISKDLFFIAYNDSLHYISTHQKGFSDDVFMFHLLKKDGTFKNLDFAAENKMQIELSGKKEDKLIVMSLPLDLSDFVGFRTGQYIRDGDGKPVNLWSKQLSKKDLGKGKYLYTSQMDDHLGVHFLEEQFHKDLNEGVFFENPFEFYILLTKQHVYLIAPSQKNLEIPIMLHFVKQDFTFDNSSFQFSSHQIDSHFGTKFQKMHVARALLPKSPFTKIRFGQYTPEGNEWVQEVWPEDLWRNPLLKYNGELVERTLE